MKDWFTTRKVEKAYKDDIKALEDVYAKKIEVVDKIREIDQSDLNDDEKKGLVGILEIQKKQVERDILSIGIAMSKYFDSLTIENKIVPIGVELEKDYLYTVKYKDLSDASVLTSNLTRGNPNTASNMAVDLVANIEDQKLAERESLRKIKTIGKIPFKGNLKEKLKTRQKDQIKKNEKDIVKIAKNMTKSDKESKKREMTYIYGIVKELVSDGNVAELVENASLLINNIEGKLTYSPLYKSFVDVIALESLLYSVPHSQDLTKELKKEYIASLFDSGKFVLCDSIRQN